MFSTHQDLPVSPQYPILLGSAQKMPPKTTAGVSTRPRNAEMHPGTPDIPTPRRSSAEVAAEKARKETELEQLRANHAATLLRIAELEAEGKAKVKQVNQPSTVALNVRCIIAFEIRHQLTQM